MHGLLQFVFRLLRRDCSRTVVVLVEGMRLEQRLGETPAQPWPTSNHRGTTTAFWKSLASLRRRWYVISCSHSGKEVTFRPLFVTVSFVCLYAGLLKKSYCLHQWLTGRCSSAKKAFCSDVTWRDVFSLCCSIDVYSRSFCEFFAAGNVNTFLSLNQVKPTSFTN